jgi:two-component system response regulator DesR
VTDLRLLLAEDTDLIAAAFEALLASEPGFVVVGRVDRGDHIVQAVRALRPHVAILDIDLPGCSGLDAAAELSTAVPDCKILLLTALEGPGHLHRALRSGAHGYVTKTSTATRLIEAVYTVAGGGTAIDPDMAAEAIRSGANPLTAREVDILKLVADGLDTASIAHRLHLGRGTVRNYLSNAMLKTGAGNRSAAVARAEMHGWL